MSVCPNTSHPDWKVLEARVGKKNAYTAFIRNGYQIPKISNRSKEISYDLDGSTFDRLETMDRLDKNPVFAKKIMDKLKELYPAINVFEGGLFDENGRWKKIPAGKMGMHRRNAFIGAVAWANDASLETPPHEYAHEYIEMFRNHPLIKKGIEQYGEENLADMMGKDFTQWMINGQGSPEYNLAQEIWRAIKSLFGFTDVKEMIFDNFRRGQMLQTKVHPGTGIYNFQDRNKELKRINGTTDLGSQFDGATIDAVSIDDDLAKFYLSRELRGKAAVDFDSATDEYGVLSPDVPVNEGNAKYYFLQLRNRVKQTDTVRKGDANVYAESPGLASKQLTRFTQWLEVDGNAHLLVQQILGIKEAPTEGPNLEAYNMSLMMMKKLNFLKKKKNSFAAGNGKMVNMNPVMEQIAKEISETADKRQSLYDKGVKIFGQEIKHPALERAFKYLEKNVLRYFINPYLTSKYLSGGTNTTFHRMFYDSLEHAGNEKVKYLMEFNEALQGDISEDYNAWSSFNRKGMNINEYVGNEFAFYVNETAAYSLDGADGKLQNVKLTNAEILSAYLMLRQDSDLNGNPPPAKTLKMEGFFLDEIIDGRNITATSRLTMTSETAKAINDYVKSNKDMLDMVSRIDNAMGGMYQHTNNTFKQENGYDLPNMPNYFPVYTGNSTIQIAKGKSTIQDFKNVRGRLGTNTPLRIGDSNKVLKVYSNHAALYASHALPIENNRKMLELLKPLYADKQESGYVDQLEGYLNKLEDPSNLYANQGEKNWEKLLNKITSNFSVSVLAMNLPVMGKQPVSYLAAKEEIDAKYLSRAGWGAMGIVGISPKQIINSLKWTGVKKGKTLLPAEWNLDMDNDTYRNIAKYSAKLKYRMEGAISRELGEAMVAEQTEGDKVRLPRWLTGGKRVEISKTRLMEGIKIFDSATIMGIWKAVEFETADVRPDLAKDSPEYWEHVAMRTEHIVNMTQPTYDMMNRTELSSMSSPMARLITMFGSARSKLGALMIDGAISTINDPSPENKRKLLKRSVNIMVLNAVAITLIDSLREFAFTGFDDDDELEAEEEFLRYMKFGTIGNSMGAFYGISDITRLAISRVDNQPWTSTLQHPVEALGTETVTAMVDIVRIGKTDKRTGEYDYTIDDGLSKALKVLLKGTGLPLTPYSYPERAYKESLED